MSIACDAWPPRGCCGGHGAAARLAAAGGGGARKTRFGEARGTTTTGLWKRTLPSRLPSREPFPCNPVAESALHPLTWCSESVSSKGSNPPDELSFHRAGITMETKTNKKLAARTCWPRRGRRVRLANPTSLVLPPLLPSPQHSSRIPSLPASLSFPELP